MHVFQFPVWTDSDNIRYDDVCMDFFPGGVFDAGMQLYWPYFYKTGLVCAAGYADSLRSEIYLMLASEHPGWEGAVAVVNDQIEEKR